MSDLKVGKWQRSWKLLLTLTVASLFVFLAVRGADWNEIFDIARAARRERLLAGFFIVTLALFMRACRWRVILARPSISSRMVFWATAAGYLGNSVLPARAGELIRSSLVAANSDLTTSYALATTIAERIVDSVTLLLVTLVALSSSRGLPPAFLHAAHVFAVLALLAVAVLVWFPRIEFVTARLIAHVMPGRISKPTLSFIQQFSQGTQTLRNGKRAFSYAVLTAAVWMLDGTFGLVLASSFGFALSIAQVYILLAALGLSSAIVATPGYIGTYQFVAVTVLGFWGFGRNQALLFIIGFQAISYCVVILWGGLGIWKLRFNFIRLSQYRAFH
jgi:glycosyltransferase 2 family protein